MGRMGVEQEDLVNNSEYVEALISRYSQYIDEYKFDALRHKIYDPIFGRDGDDKEWLTNIYNSLMGKPSPRLLDSPCRIAYWYLITAIQIFEDNNVLINGVLEHNKNSIGPLYGFDFNDNNHLTISSDIIPEHFFNGSKFLRSKIYIKARKIGKEAFKDVHMYNSSLYIEEGCEEIDKHALEGDILQSIYLPKSLKRLGLQTFNRDLVSSLHYNGTSSEYIELLKNSGWKKIPKSHRPVFCSDKTVWGGLDLTTL